VNAICPAFVQTGITPVELRHIWPKEQTTPMTTILKAVDTVLGDDKMTGQTIELTLDELHFRTKPDYSNESQRWSSEDAGVWLAHKYNELAAGSTVTAVKSVS
jgi:15-hydroxyprostaglandin dehydrogenase (NAD)